MTDKDSKLIYEAYSAKKDDVEEKPLEEGVIGALAGGAAGDSLTDDEEKEDGECPMSDEEHDNEEDQEIGDEAKQISKHLENLTFELQRLNDSIGLYVRGKRPASFVSGPEQQQQQ
jgi:hypothetical protein